MDAAAMVSSSIQYPSLAERTLAYSNIQCPHCLRKFSEKAALRHIPVCPQINKQQMTPAPVASKAMDLKKPGPRVQRSPEGRTPVLQPRKPEHNFSNISTVRDDAADKTKPIQTLQQLRQARRSIRNQEWSGEGAAYSREAIENQVYNLLAAEDSGEEEDEQRAKFQLTMNPTEPESPEEQPIGMQPEKQFEMSGMASKQHSFI